MTDAQLIISRRDAKVSSSINCRTEKAGSENGAKATDLTLSEIHLSPEEVCSFVREPLAHRALFVTRSGSKLMDPLFKRFAPQRLLDKIERAVVTIYTGLNGQEINLGLCKLARIQLEPKTGGMTAMSCQVQATPTLDKRIGALLEAMGSNVQVEVTYEHNAEQPDLTLGAAGPGDDEDEDEDETPPKTRRGRRTRAVDGDRAH